MQGFNVILTFVIFVTFISLYSLIYSKNLHLNDVSNYDLSYSVYKTITPFTLALIRLTMGSTIWITCANLLIDNEGLDIVLSGRDKKLIRLNIKYLERFTTFTNWCWTLQGFYFFFVLLNYFETNDIVFHESNLLTRITWILFELSFALSFLVSCTVTYILLPTLISTKQPTDTFFNIPSLLAHNANVIFMVIELMINRIPIYLCHLPFVLLFGVCYVVFSWYWFKVKGIFYYFFLDYETKNSLIWQVGLMTVLMLFYSLGWFLSSLKTNYGLLTNIILVALTWSLVKLKP